MPAACNDWVYANCNLLGAGNEVMESHCIVPLPFPFFGPGRSLAALEDIHSKETSLLMGSIEERLVFHQRMVLVLEELLASIQT